MTLRDDDTAILNRLTIFLYADDYLTDNSSGAFNHNLGPIRKMIGDDMQDEILSTHAAMYGIGDKYSVNGLKTASKNKYAKALRGEFLLANFFNSIKIACSTVSGADDTLQQKAVAAAQKTISRLAAEAEFEAIVKALS